MEPFLVALHGRAVLGPGYVRGWARGVPPDNLASMGTANEKIAPSLTFIGRPVPGPRPARGVHPRTDSMRDRAVPRTGFFLRRDDSTAGSGDARPYLRLVGSEPSIPG